MVSSSYNAPLPELPPEAYIAQNKLAQNKLAPAGLEQKGQIPVPPPKPQRVAAAIKNIGTETLNASRPPALPPKPYQNGNLSEHSAKSQAKTEGAAKVALTVPQETSATVKQDQRRMVEANSQYSAPNFIKGPKEKDSLPSLPSQTSEYATVDLAFTKELSEALEKNPNVAKQVEQNTNQLKFLESKLGDASSGFARNIETTKDVLRMNIKNTYKLLLSEKDVGLYNLLEMQLNKLKAMPDRIAEYLDANFI